jgi:hypothetical protein
MVVENFYVFKMYINKNKEIEKSFNVIDEKNEEFIKYDKFLKRQHLVSIEENNEYLPLKTKDKVIMILSKKNFEMTDTEDIFEILNDYLD